MHLKKIAYSLMYCLMLINSTTAAIPANKVKTKCFTLEFYKVDFNDFIRIMNSITTFKLKNKTKEKISIITNKKIPIKQADQIMISIIDYLGYKTIKRKNHLLIKKINENDNNKFIVQKEEAEIIVSPNKKSHYQKTVCLKLYDSDIYTLLKLTGKFTNKNILLNNKYNKRIKSITAKHIPVKNVWPFVEKVLKKLNCSIEEDAFFIKIKSKDTVRSKKEENSEYSYTKIIGIISGPSGFQYAALKNTGLSEPPKIYKINDEFGFDYIIIKILTDRILIKKKNNHKKITLFINKKFNILKLEKIKSSK